MNNKATGIILYAILGIPVPISVISWIGSIISLANVNMMNSGLVAVFAVITMLFAGTYAMTYAISVYITIKKKRLNIYSFIPMIHIAITVLFFCLWSYAEKI